MNINVISVGKVKEDYFRAGLAEYEKRLSRFCRFKSIVIPDKSIPENPSEKEKEAILDSEGKLIMAKIGKNDKVIAMCVEGKNMASEEFAYKMKRYLEESGNLSFIIGGSLGLSDEVKNRADLCLSLGKMTFPHRIARLVLEEQIFRAFKINSNETYHK